MKAFKITDIRNCMNKLLTGDTFEDFLLEQATVRTYNEFTIDGRIQKDFFDEKEEELPPYDFSNWQDIQSYVHSFIKGKKTPLGIHLVMRLKPDKEAFISEDSSRNYILNVHYSEGKLSLVSATYQKEFSLDKDPEKKWDLYLTQFLIKKDISFEEMS